MIFQGREAVQIENERIRVTVLREGGHIVEVLDKATGINPLWNPPWNSIEPSTYEKSRHPEYGDDSEARLLSGIMGHNLCLDVFGPPSQQEFEAGVDVHGESSVMPYHLESSTTSLRAEATFPIANLQFTRTIELQATSPEVAVEETVQNLSGTDRPIAWTQHVTLGPPFLEHGSTKIEIPALRSRTFEAPFGRSDLTQATEFQWPHAPTQDGSTSDLAVFGLRSPSAGYTAHLLSTRGDGAMFSVFSPKLKLRFGYQWKTADFPWLGRWEEHQSRATTPWLGRTVALGLEFGVSPYPETRRQMIDRSKLFNTPVYRWLPAKGSATVQYRIRIEHADHELESQRR